MLPADPRLPAMGYLCRCGRISRGCESDSIAKRVYGVMLRLGDVFAKYSKEHRSSREQSVGGEADDRVSKLNKQNAEKKIRYVARPVHFL